MKKSGTTRLLACVLVFSMMFLPLAAQGYWSHSKTLVPHALQAGEIARPGSLSCTERVIVLGGIAATIAWNAVPNADSYVVMGVGGDGQTRQIARVTALNYQFSQGLLDGLLGALLNLLFGSGPAKIYVQAVHGTNIELDKNWLSKPSSEVDIRKATTLESLLGGFKCVP